MCGAPYRFEAADVPPTGKTVACGKCRARIVIPPQDLPLAGGTGDVIDLADLPAPRRLTGGAPVDLSPEADLPAPKAARPALRTGQPVDLPAPRVPTRRDLEPLTLDSVDLVAPVGPVSRTMTPVTAVPSVPGSPIDLPGAAGLFDNLPAPKGPPPKKTMARGSPEPVPPVAIPPIPPIPAIPAIPSIPSIPPIPTAAPAASAAAPAHGLDPTDLPTPKRPADLDLLDVKAPLGDLPAPKRAPAVPGLFDDLPVPKGAPLGDLPMPKGPAAMDLPAPRTSGTIDLPMPKGLGDLPVPKRSSVPDVPVPKRAVPDGAAQTGGLDLPAPKGFFDDLPAPATSAGPQLPAPKGFFDDLPQPATAGGAQLPAPKGFFDDLPQPALPGTEVAPKGFFDDLPQPASSSSAQLPAPKGFFDELPQPSMRADRFGSSSTPAVSQPGIALDGLDLLPPIASPAAPARPEARSRPGPEVPALELAGDEQMDLPPVTAPAGPRGGVVSFKAPTGAPGPAPRSAARDAAPADLDLAVPSRRETASSKSSTLAAPDKVAKKAGLSPRLRRVILAAVLALAAVGAGGFVMFRRYQAAQERAAEIDRTLRTARKQLAAGERGHWRKATRTALPLAPRHAEAAGIAAQGALAGYLDEGTDGDARIAAGRRFLDQAKAAGRRHAALDKASALRDLIEGEATAAIAVLQPIAARGDADAALYLGWAQLAAQQWSEAQKSFEAAKGARPVPALYGIAQAQAGAGDHNAAHATYLAVIALDAEHVGALVGEAITAPVTGLAKRETALLAILQRKGIEEADPRVVVQAWTRAGDDALHSGRLDAARERYRKALAILPADRGALASVAALELADGNLDLAAEASAKVLALAPDDAAANLTAAELDLRRGQIPEAAQRLSALRNRQPPLAGAELLGRLELLDGMRLEAEHNTNAALAAYDRAAQVAGNTDVAPVIAAATLLGRLADEADRAKQADQARTLREQADQRLATIAAGAESDANVAITLGVAYLSAGAPDQAERWLRGAIEKRPSAVEAHYQLAEALRRQGKQDEAVATLVKAFELDPTRIDLGVELARGFEAARRDADAAGLYKRLLASKDVTADVRARAGRFFARTGDITAARQQGELLLAANPEDAVGLFLKAEGLLADGRPVEARRLMQEAVLADPDAQIFDGLGRAAEAYAAQNGDTAMRDEALRAYAQASERDPTMPNPWLGAGRLHLARAEYEKALVAYEQALKLAPRNPDIPYGIGIAYAELEDAPRAIEWLARAVAVQPRADAYWKLGSLYYEADRAGPAAAALTQATQLAIRDEREHGVTVPWLTDALWLLGTVQQVLRNDRATLAAWEAYLARNPTNTAQADEVRANLTPLRRR